MNSISVNDMLERLQDYIFGELASGVGIEHPESALSTMC